MFKPSVHEIPKIIETFLCYCTDVVLIFVLFCGPCSLIIDPQKKVGALLG